MQVVRLTTRETSLAIQRQYGGKLIPEWKMRRVVDDLEARDIISVQRAGAYRTIADSDLQVIANELRRIGRLAIEVTAC